MNIWTYFLTNFNAYNRPFELSTFFNEGKYNPRTSTTGLNEYVNSQKWYTVFWHFLLAMWPFKRTVRARMIVYRLNIHAKWTQLANPSRFANFEKSAFSGRSELSSSFVAHREDLKTINHSSVRVFGNDSKKGTSLLWHVWLNKLPAGPDCTHRLPHWCRTVPHFCPHLQFSCYNRRRRDPSSESLFREETNFPSVRPSVRHNLSVRNVVPKTLMRNADSKLVLPSPPGWKRGQFIFVAK